MYVFRVYEVASYPLRIYTYTRNVHWDLVFSYALPVWPSFIQIYDHHWVCVPVVLLAPRDVNMTSLLAQFMMSKRSGICVWLLPWGRCTYMQREFVGSGLRSVGEFDPWQQDVESYVLFSSLMTTIAKNIYKFK